MDVDKSNSVPAKNKRDQRYVLNCFGHFVGALIRISERSNRIWITLDQHTTDDNRKVLPVSDKSDIHL